MKNNSTSDYVKLEVAREILNTMIGYHGRKGYDTNNKDLIQVLADEKTLATLDMKEIDKIIKKYGPILKDSKYEL